MYVKNMDCRNICYPIQYDVNVHIIPFKAKNDTIRQLIIDGINVFGNNADLNYIDTSDVTDMTHLFSYTSFNGDISS